jgi:glycosyltransferase involved in cell wall biosynthesis
MRKAFYFVPSLDIGGVEIAIEKSLPVLRQHINISIFYVRRSGSLDVDQMPWWRALQNIFVGRPDVVITSLWWAHPIGLLFKLVGIRWVCFIHNAGVTHTIDRIVCTASIRLADVVATDSDQSASFVRSIKTTVTVHVIPYVFPRLPRISKIERIRNSFIFVGRNAEQKRIDLVVKFFKHILNSVPNATCRFVIAGDIPKAVSNLIALFGHRVTVDMDLSNNEVLYRLYASEYFVVLSDFEGFCMAANEAVQAGCFVIYRDVGEIKNYVLPDLSFKVMNPQNFYTQFDEVLSKRNEIYPINFESIEPKLQRKDSGTYTSRFMALIEG